MAGKITKKMYICQDRRTLVAKYKRKQSGWGFTSERDGFEELRFVAFVDMDALDALAQKAGRNKSGKAHDGALHVEIANRKKVE